MAKSKKNRQADFQKVKLKVGKKLKKADNVTSTSFKTRKIQVSQRLKTGQESAPSTKKRQNISELFTQCRHYSVSVRQEAIAGLKELITAHPDLVQAHLADLLEKTAELLTDKDPKVRQGAVRLLKTCLPKISEKLVSPFFPLLSAHLCCAMTHIVDEIQVDSLSVLDILLEQYPKLIITASNQILENFVEQISRQRGHSESKRRLATNPNSRTSSQKWRKSVFSRLHKFLSAMLRSQTSVSHDGSKAPEVVVDVTSTYTELSQLFPAHMRSQWENPGFILGSEAKDQWTRSAGLIGERLRDFAATLMPLMLECWVEAAPSQSRITDQGSQLLQENAGAMYSVLQVTQALLEAMDMYYTGEDHAKWPRTKYMKEFSKHFLINFPYDVYLPPGERKEQQEQVSADTLNLTICDIMSRFLPQSGELPGTSPPPPWLHALTQYLRDFLGGRYNRGTVARSCRTVVKIVNRLIQARVDSESLEEIVLAMFQRFRGGNRLTQEKQTYLQFFARIMLDCIETSGVSFDMQQSFLKSLPELLPLAVEENPEMAALVISVMQQAACQRCFAFMQDDPASVQQWFEPDDGIILKLPARERTGLLSVLYSLPEINTEFGAKLTMLARHRELTESQTAFLIQCLQNRYIRAGEEPDTARGHVTLLCQLVLGMTREEMKQTIASSDPEVTEDLIGGFKIIPCANVPMLSRRHSLIVQLVCGVVSQCKNSRDITNIMFKVIQAYLMDDKVVPLPVVFGICSFASLLQDYPAAGLGALSNLSVSALVFSLTCGLECRAQSEEMVTRLQDTACSLIVRLPGALDFLTRQVQTKSADCTVQTLSALTMSCQLLLNSAAEKKLFHTCNQFKCMLASLKTVMEGIEQSVEADVCIPAEVSRQVVELEYRLSTAPWS